MSFMEEKRKYWRQTDVKTKANAHRILRYCVKRGWLTRGDKCERCGSRYWIDAHHPDYTKPLEVEWLCRSCHKLEHGARGPNGQRHPDAE